MAKSTRRADVPERDAQAAPKAARRGQVAPARSEDGAAPPTRRPRTANTAGATGRARKSVSAPVAREVAADSPGTAEAGTSRHAREPFATQASAPTREQIARRAYEIFAGRGGAPGDPMDDWLQAEAELRHRR